MRYACPTFADVLGKLIDSNLTMASTPRCDGRLASQIRPPALEEGLLHRADGSARLAVGHTVALAAVFGPGASKGAKPGDRPDQLSMEVVFGGGGGGAGGSSNAGVAADKVASYRARILEVLKGCVRLDAYPRCGLVVALRVLRDDGGALAALVNAAAAALMDAGVEMACLPVGCAFAWEAPAPPPFVVDGVASTSGLDDGELIVDPDSAEEAAHATITVVVAAGMPGSTLALVAAGPIGASTLAQCAAAADSAALTYAEINRRKHR
jgi:ribonuclease PH